MIQKTKASKLGDFLILQAHQIIQYSVDVQ